MAQELMGVNVYWKKNGTDEEKVTFIMAQDHVDAYEKVLKMKGGTDKITITKAQCYNREKKVLAGNPTFFG